MKKVVLTVACLVSILTVSIAQEVPQKGRGKGDKIEQRKANKKTAEERAQLSVDHLVSKAGIDAVQKTKVYDLALTRAKSVDAIREKYKGQKDNKEAAKKEIMEVRKTYHQSVKGLLTPEQIAKLKASRPAKAGMKNKKEEELDLGGDND